MKHKIWVLLVLVSTILAACGPTSPTPPPGPNQTWIDAPLPGAIPLAPYLLQFHAGSFFGVDEFEVKINGIVLGTTPPSPIVGEGGGVYGTLFYGEYLWDPAAPGTYLIEVRPQAQGQFGPAAQVQVTIGSQALAEVPDDVPLIQPQDCMWIAAVAINVRGGPDINLFEPITSVEPGTELPVVGQSQQGFHWAVELRPGLVGYVTKSEDYGSTTGDCDDVPVLQDPAAPPAARSTPTSTSGFQGIPPIIITLPPTPIPPPN